MMDIEIERCGRRQPLRLRPRARQDLPLHDFLRKVSFKKKGDNHTVCTPSSPHASTLSTDKTSRSHPVTYNEERNHDHPAFAAVQQ